MPKDITDEEENKETVIDDDIQEDLQKAIALAEENLSGWKRTQADFENFRRRTEAESMDLIAAGKYRAFSQLLPVIDSLEQALTYAPEIADEKYIQWKNGLLGIVKQLDAALTESGITKIEAIGKPFDPHLHEAVREVHGDTEGQVAEQYQQGYMMDGKVIRPAQVGISKKSEGDTVDG